MKNRPAIVVAVLLLAAAALSLSVAAEREAVSGKEEIRVFRLSHIDTKTAVTMFRTLLQTRVVAEVPAQQTVILRDTPDVLARAEQLMADLDAAQPRWSAELVVDSGKREQVIREIDLAGFDAGIWFGENKTQYVGLELDCGPAGNGMIVAEYEISLRLIDSEGSALGFKENGEARLTAGDSLTIFRTTRTDHRRALSSVLGLDGEADALRLRFKQR